MSKRNKMGSGKHAMKSPRGVHDALPQVELSNEAAQQVEKELCWCILQLQTSLILHKMTPKQAQDASHTINILKSPTAPLAKKRQIMRNTFGDYRAKMAEEENQFRKGNIQMRFNTLSPSKKSSFVKKSTSIIKKRFEPSNNGFNFNFSDISPSEKVVEDVSGLNCTTTGEATDKVGNNQSNTSKSLNQGFQYNASDNSFKFNFT